MQSEGFPRTDTFPQVTPLTLGRRIGALQKNRHAANSPQEIHRGLTKHSRYHPDNPPLPIEPSTNNRFAARGGSTQTTQRQKTCRPTHLSSPTNTCPTIEYHDSSKHHRIDVYGPDAADCVLDRGLNASYGLAAPAERAAGLACPPPPIPTRNIPQNHTRRHQRLADTLQDNTDMAPWLIMSQPIRRAHVWQKTWRPTMDELKAFLARGARYSTQNFAGASRPRDAKPKRTTTEPVQSKGSKKQCEGRWLATIASPH